MLTKKEHIRLLETARAIRHSIIDTTLKAGGAHIGGGMSALDIMVALYFKYMNIDPSKPDDPDRDRFVLSKGHSAIGYIPVLAERGYFDKKLLDTFNKFKSPKFFGKTDQMHMTHFRGGSPSFLAPMSTPC